MKYNPLNSEDRQLQSGEESCADPAKVRARKMAFMILRLMIILIGAGLFLRFFLPIPFKGVLNIGNTTGLVGSTIVIVYGIFFEKINALLAAGFHHIPWRIAELVIGTAVALILILVIVETGCMIYGVAGHKPQTESCEADMSQTSNQQSTNTQADAIDYADATLIVLGCKVHAIDHPSEMLVSRLDTAYDYLIAHPEAVAVLSGGQGEDEPVTEAACMEEYLIAKGIAADRLYKEEQSTDTKENLRYSKELIEEVGLSEQVVILTNEFHAYRAGNIAVTLGMDYSIEAADTPGWALPTFYVRELYGILRDWIVLGVS